MNNQSPKPKRFYVFVTTRGENTTCCLAFQTNLEAELALKANEISEAHTVDGELGLDSYHVVDTYDDSESHPLALWSYLL